MTSLAFLSEIVQKTGTENSETMQIKRNGYGEGQKEAALSMQVEGEKKQDIEIRVSPKIYSEKRLEKEFQKARKELAKVISGENKDLSHIKTDLDLVTALDDFPFSVSWELAWETGSGKNPGRRSGESGDWDEYYRSSAL